MLQAAFIGVAAVLGVYAAKFALEDILIHRALRDEASHYWERIGANPGFPLPDTHNMTGYLVPGAPNVPPELKSLGVGLHKVAREGYTSLVYVSERNGKRLLLVFDGERVSAISLYFGLIPLGGVLIAIYLSTWIAYHLSHRAVSPIIWLARQVREFSTDAPEESLLTLEQLPHDADQDVLDLSEALARFSHRIREFIERERNFTRDVSHELRNAITVIKIAADMLITEQQLSLPARKSAVRIKHAAADMEELTEAFLLLARESEKGFSEEAVCINNIIEDEVERAKNLLLDKPVTVEITADDRLMTVASEKVLSVLIGNLIRNAFSYTDQGHVHIHVGRSELTIEDSGVGIADADVKKVFKPFFRADSGRRGGHGVGLTIVKRFSDRFGWPVDIESRPGIGTRVIVRFPDAPL